MKLKTLTTAILLTLPTAGTFAAALDRSGQSMSAFLQPGNYFEAGVSVLDPTVKGKESGVSETKRSIDDMADDYFFPSAALKLQLTDKISFGLLYDQPFGASAAYSGENVFVANSTDQILGQTTLDALTKATTQKIQALMTPHVINYYTTNQINPATATAAQQQQALGYANQQTDVVTATKTAQATAAAIKAANGYLGKDNTEVDVDTQNLSLVFGFQPSENFNIYGGGVYQTVKGNVKLRGQAYSLFNGYDARIKETGGTGWLAGAAFQIPDIALKVSATYRSEIEHDVDATESLSVMGYPGLNPVLNGLGVTPTQLQAIATPGKTKITTPQSVNLDFQTGIMENTVAFANVRWVDWSNFSIQPHQFGKVSEAVGNLIGRPNGFNLVEYSDDQISATVGVGRKLNDKWAGNVSVGWDSGAGNPVSTLGPTEGYWNVGLGLQYSPTPATFIAGGVKYFDLGDAHAQTGAQAGGSEYVASFEDGYAIAYGLKMGYKF